LLLSFDTESPPGDIIAATVPTLVEMILGAHGGTRFTTRELLRKAIPIWNLISQEEQISYDSRVRACFKSLIQATRFNSLLIDAI
jgi:hypothetical protein